MASTVPNVELQIRAMITSLLHAREEDVTRDKSLAQLGADSLDIVSLIMAVEDEFDLDVPDEEAAEISTVRGLIEYVLLAPRD